MTLRKLHFQDHVVHLYESNHREGDVVTMHHHDGHQILYGLEGEGSITLDGRTQPIGADVVALIAPFSEHAIVTGGKLTVLVLAFEQTALDGFAREELLGKNFGASALLKLNPFASSELRRLLRKMLYEQAHSSTLGAYAMKLHLQELLLVLARSRQTPHASDANSLRAERMRSYIDTHYFEPLTTSDIAVRMNMSDRHVSNIFKERFQKTPAQYLTEVRIEVACKLLTETDKDIVSICFEVGYDSVSAFYRAFKTIAGMSPNHYRQTAKQRLEYGTELK